MTNRTHSTQKNVQTNSKMDRNKLESGEIQVPADKTGKTSGLAYNDDLAYNESLGARVDLDTQPAQQDQALRNTISQTIGNRRDEQVEQLPHDSIETGKGEKNPHEPSDESGMNHKNF